MKNRGEKSEVENRCTKIGIAENIPNCKIGVKNPKLKKG